MKKAPPKPIPNGPVNYVEWNGKKYAKVEGKTFYMGRWFNPALKEWQMRLYLFGITPEGPQKFQHWKAWVQMVWPEPIFIWDEWCDLYFAALCGDKETIERITGKPFVSEDKWWMKVISTGCASSGKSSKAAMWVLGKWLCAREHTSVILTSTSLGMLQKRIWAELCEWIRKSKFPLPCEIVPSDLIIRYSKGDSRSAIFGVAVKSGGDTQEAVDRIKGIHNRRVFVVIDEMTAVAPAITAACSNLNKGTTEFQLQGLANAVPGENEHTRYCEPTHGWNTVTVEDQFWTTKMGGCCLHFDGHRSPALKEPQRFPFYVNQEQLDADVKQFGGENTPEYWTNDRGYWPPTGLSNAVMDLALLNQFEVEKPAIWKEAWTMGAAFDPAFEGGDRRVLYPFKFGEFSSGVTGIELQRPIIVAIDITTDVRWIHYAIADAVENHCKSYQCDGKPAAISPKNFIMDTSGEGGGLFSVLSGRWSLDIQSVEFGGAAEKVQIYPDRPTTYHELYGNKVTMLWYAFRTYAEGGQVRGLTDSQTRKELIARNKSGKVGKITVQPKKEMKLAMHNSPDMADSCVLTAEFLRRLGVPAAGKTGGGSLLSLDQWNREAEEINSYSEEFNYEEA